MICKYIISVLYSVTEKPEEWILHMTNSPEEWMFSLPGCK